MQNPHKCNAALGPEVLHLGGCHCISNPLSGSRKPRSITRMTLTEQQKKKLCEMFNTRYKNKELAEIFSISPSTVTLIVSEKDK